MNLDSVKKVYFIGIGGIGMSALAQLLAERGIAVSGSDQSTSPVTEKLTEKNITVTFDQTADNITDDIDLVVYTIAIPDDQAELMQAREMGIAVKTYPEMLGVVSKGSYTIAISGTHGKTTTTAMTADVLVDGGLKPTAIVGSLVSRYKSNFIPGAEKYFLVESCEYKRSFLNINPNILAITNLEEDHLDYYKDLAEIQEAFADLAYRVPTDGFLVCDPSDPNIRAVLENSNTTVVDYTKMPMFDMKVPGIHNKQNAQVAYAIGQLLNVSDEKITESLKNFSGTWRRFEYKGETKKGALVFDDYAHHPRELQVTLQTLREKYPDKKLTVIFQPHLFSRTKSLLEDFAKSFTGIDRAIVLPIYAAREKEDAEISHNILVSSIQKETSNAEAMNSFREVAGALESAGSEDVIMTMGAGDVYKVAEQLVTGDK